MSACLAVLLLAATAFFERIVPLEVQTGVVRLRTVEAPLLEVPDVREWKLGPWSVERFARLYRMEFFLETRTSDGKIVLEERGANLVAARLDSRTLQELDEALRARLSGLGADAFVRDLATIHETTAPFDWLMHVSTEPSWSCVRGKGFGERGRAGAYTSHGFRGLEFEGRVCDGLWQAAEGAPVEEIRTLSAPRRLRELSVRLEWSSTLPEELPRAEAATLPQGASLTRRKTEDGRCGGIVSVHDDGEYVCEGIEWKARTSPTSLPPDLLLRAFASRWTLEEAERTLGLHPRREVRSETALLVAWIPIAPTEDAPSERIPTRLDFEALRAELGLRLQMRPTLDIQVVEDAMGAFPVPELGGFLMAVCGPDGTAWFGLPPTLAQSPISNAALFCAALDRVVPRS